MTVIVNKRQVSSPNVFLGRIKLMAAGCALTGVGILRLLGGVQVVRHSNGQPMFSWGLIAGGIVCFVFVFIPVSWVAKAVESSRPKSRSH